MPVRPMRADERAAVEAMMAQLWPEDAPEDYDFGEVVWVWERETGGLGGFVSAALRPWAEGCASAPCPYVEGWWVAPDLRRRGVGGALFAAVEDWARSQGFTELGSDALLENTASRAAHVALGFEPILRLELFRKRLG